MELSTLFSHLMRSVDEISMLMLSNYCKSSATVEDERVSYQGMIEHLKQEEIHHGIVRFNGNKHRQKLLGKSRTKENLLLFKTRRKV